MAAISQPMLFMQGDRDRLADLDLLRPLIDELEERVDLHVVEGGDHSFEVLKRSGRQPTEVEVEMVDTVSSWIRQIVGLSAPIASPTTHGEPS